MIKNIVKNIMLLIINGSTYSILRRIITLREAEIAAKQIENNEIYDFIIRSGSFNYMKTILVIVFIWITFVIFMNFYEIGKGYFGKK